MRAIVAVLLIAFTSGVAVASKNRFIDPQSVSINFGASRYVVFALSGTRVVGVTAHMGTIVAHASKNMCAKLHDVQFESVKIIYGPTDKPFDPTNGFAFQFNVGPESRRSAGELPSVQLNFYRDGSSDASITRRDGDTWTTTEL
jgi:hypothetical protein